MTPTTDAALTIAPARCDDHLLQLALHAQEHARQVDGDHPVPCLLVVVGNTGAHAADPSVVEGTVECAETLDRGGDHRVSLSESVTSQWT